MTLSAEGSACTLEIEALPEAPGEAAAIVGALLNFALAHAVDRRSGGTRP